MSLWNPGRVAQRAIDRVFGHGTITLVRRANPGFVLGIDAEQREHLSRAIVGCRCPRPSGVRAAYRLLNVACGHRLSVSQQRQTRLDDLRSAATFLDQSANKDLVSITLKKQGAIGIGRNRTY